MRAPVLRRLRAPEPSPDLAAFEPSRGRHAGEYDETFDRLRKNGTLVPARHSSEPDTLRAVLV